jgi:hypothetical protein
MFMNCHQSRHRMFWTTFEFSLRHYLRRSSDHSTCLQFAMSASSGRAVVTYSMTTKLTPIQGGRYNPVIILTSLETANFLRF